LCSSLRSICIPSSVTAIPSRCFSYCTQLSSVKFEAGSRISTLGESAFHSCASLQSICLPSSVETVSTLCFSECGQLSSVTFEAGSKLSSLGNGAFSQACPGAFVFVSVLILVLVLALLMGKRWTGS
jgi:hypothetical protein